MGTDTKSRIGRPGLERALYDFTGYQADATAVDGFMMIVDAYVAEQVDALRKAPEPLVEAYFHALTQLGEQLIDTGGKLKLVPPASKTVVKTVAATLNGGGGQDGRQVCRTCGITKKFAEFYKDSKMKNGHKGQCKDCEREQKDARRRLNAA